MNVAESHEFMQFLQNAAHRLSDCGPILVILDRDCRIGEGSMRVVGHQYDVDRYNMAKSNNVLDNSYGFEYVSDTINSFDDLEYVVSLGIKDFDNVDLRGTLPFDVGLLSVQIAINHEYRHLQQYEVARGRMSRPKDMSNAVISSLITSRHNRTFYHRNYESMPHEIDAERFGIIETYHNNIRNCVFSDIDDTMFAVGKYFKTLGINIVPFDYSFNEHRFVNATNRVFNKSLNACRNVRSLTGSLSITNTDFVNSYFDKNPDELRFFKSLKRGSDQDVYLAMVVMQHHPEDKHFFDINSLAYPDGLRFPSGESPMRNVMVAKPDMLFDSLADDISLHRKQISDAFTYEFG